MTRLMPGIGRNPRLLAPTRPGMTYLPDVFSRQFPRPSIWPGLPYAHVATVSNCPIMQ